MLFSRGFLGQSRWGEQTGAPGTGPFSVSTQHPAVPVGLTYEPGIPPTLWGEMQFGDPEMPPFMVTEEAKKDPVVHQRGPVGWGYNLES